MINVNLSGVVRTLILTLRARAEEQDHETPILTDPESKEWYAFVPDAPALDQWYNPQFQLATVIRSRLIDDAVEAFIEAHDNPLIVELGAGFSTRYYRIGRGRSRWIELDLEEAVVVRRKLDVEVKEHWFLPADMTESDWIEHLPEVEPQDVLFIAEGTLMFADETAVQTLITMLAEHFAGATFIFDVLSPGYIEHAKDEFKAMNAPIGWGVTVDDLAQYPLEIHDTHYLLLSQEDRWEAIGVDASKRTEDRSGYVVEAVLT